jgi:subtilase family serine protease
LLQSRRAVRLLTLGSSSALAVAAVLAAAPTSHAATSGAVRFPGSVPGWATPKADQGATSPNTIVEGEIFLALPSQKAAQAEALAVSTPGNKLYHHYLTPTQWIADFAPSEAAYKKVVSYVDAQSFTIVGEPTSREYIVFRGKAKDVNAAFSTSEHQYSYKGAVLAAPSTAPSLPASLAGLVEGISIDQGATLTQTDDVRPGSKAATTPATSTAQATAAPAAAASTSPCSTYYDQYEQTLPKAYGVTSFPTNICGYSGTQIGGAYGTTKELTSGVTGKGETVAIVDAYDDPTIVADTAKLDAQTGTTPLTASQFADISPATSAFDDKTLCEEPSGWQAEESIDVQSSHGMAPGAKILYSGGFDCEGGLDIAVSKILDGGLANIISNSYGDAGEDLPQNTLVGEESKEYQAAAEGIGLYYSSGDYGDDASAVGYITPNFEASSPFVTAVGGTSLAISANNSYEFETAWGTTGDPVANGAYELPLPGEFFAGSSGGTSTQFAEPAYQKGIVPTSLSGTGADSGRVVPDVSSLADPYTGFLIGISPLDGSSATRTGKFVTETYGGTSLASPLFAGQIALAESATGVDIGFANPAIYSLAASDPTAFRDIPATRKKLAVAYNSARSGTTYRISLGADSSLTTTTGYDNATGVGSGYLPGLIKLADLQ